MSFQGIEPSDSARPPNPFSPPDRRERSAPTPRRATDPRPRAEILNATGAHDEAGLADAARPGSESLRLRTILDRLGERYYDRRGIQTEIAERVLPDLESHATPW